MKIIGICGPIGAGKSTALKILQRKGFSVIDADSFVHDLYEPRKIGARVIRENFSAEFLDKNGCVDRAKLREVVLSNSAKLKLLNRVMHPLITAKIEKWIRVQKKHGVEFLAIESAYFEPKFLGKLIDVLIEIRAPKEVCFQRVHRNRRLSRKEFELFWKVRPKNKADFVVRNIGTEKEIEAEFSVNWKNKAENLQKICR